MKTFVSKKFGTGINDNCQTDDYQFLGIQTIRRVMLNGRKFNNIFLKQQQKKNDHKDQMLVYDCIQADANESMCPRVIDGFSIERGDK